MHLIYFSERCLEKLKNLYKSEENYQNSSKMYNDWNNVYKLEEMLYEREREFQPSINIKAY